MLCQPTLLRSTGKDRCFGTISRLPDDLTTENHRRKLCDFHLSSGLVNQGSDFLCRLLRYRGKNVAVNVHCGGNVLVAQVLLCYLHIHALHQHNGCTQVSENVESTFGQTSLFLQLGQYLRKVFWIDRFSIEMHDNVISIYIG